MYNYFSEIAPEEKILWQGKPDKTVTLIESIFNKSLLSLLLLLAFEFYHFVVLTGTTHFGLFKNPIVATTILIINLIPFTHFCITLIRGMLNYRNSYFIVTRHRVHIFQGIHGVLHYSFPIRTLNSHFVDRSFYDSLFDVGDIILKFDNLEKKLYNGMPISPRNKHSVKEQKRCSSKRIRLYNIKRYEYAYNIILKEYNAYQEAVGNHETENAVQTSSLDGYKDLFHHISSISVDSISRSYSDQFESNKMAQGPRVLNASESNQLLTNSWEQPDERPDDVDEFFLNLDDEEKMPAYLIHPALSGVEASYNQQHTDNPYADNPYADNPYTDNNPYAMDASIPVSAAPKHVILEPYL